MSVQNCTGTPCVQSNTFEKVTSPQNEMESEKNLGANNGAIALPTAFNTTFALKSALQAVSSEDKSDIHQKPLSAGANSLHDQIEQNYLFRFQFLASSYEAKLNGLVSSALVEYNFAKQNNPDADLSSLANIYYSAGKALEAECNSQFYAILSDFESELRANSFSLDTAVKVKETYEARKSTLAKQITSGKP